MVEPKTHCYVCRQQNKTKQDNNSAEIEAYLKPSLDQKNIVIAQLNLNSTQLELDWPHYYLATHPQQTF